MASGANMQDYKEINRIRKDLVAVRSLAKRLLNLPHADWNDWEIDFLQHMSRHKGPDPITTRQGEKLLELRDDAEYYSAVRGFSVQCLIENCWLARDDLDSEENRRFIEQLKETSYSSIKRRHLRKLLACARELGEIEQYVSIDEPALLRALDRVISSAPDALLHAHRRRCRRCAKRDLDRTSARRAAGHGLQFAANSKPPLSVIFLADICPPGSPAEITSPVTSKAHTEA